MRMIVRPKIDGKWLTITDMTATWQARETMTSTNYYGASSTWTSNAVHQIAIDMDSDQTGDAITNWVYVISLISGGATYPVGTGAYTVAASTFTGAGTLLSDTNQWATRTWATAQFVPQARTVTINGVTGTLSSNLTFTVAGGTSTGAVDSVSGSGYTTNSGTASDPVIVLTPTSSNLLHGALQDFSTLSQADIGAAGGLTNAAAFDAAGTASGLVVVVTSNLNAHVGAAVGDVHDVSDFQAAMQALIDAKAGTGDVAQVAGDVLSVSGRVDNAVLAVAVNGVTNPPTAGVVDLGTIGGGTTDHAALSNLGWTESGHTIDGNVIPNADDTYNLGADGARFSGLHVMELRLGANGELRVDADTGEYEFNDGGVIDGTARIAVGGVTLPFGDLQTTLDGKAATNAALDKLLLDAARSLTNMHGEAGTYGAEWDGDSTAPTKDAVYDKLATFQEVPGNQGVLYIDGAGALVSTNSVISTTGAGPHFVIGNLTMDDAWHTLDISAYVPAAAKECHIYVNITATRLYVGNGIIIAPYGVTDTQRAMVVRPLLTTQNTNEFRAYSYDYIMCDTNQALYYKGKVDLGTITTLNITIDRYRL